MKTIYILLLSIIIFTGCKQEDITPITNTPISYYFQADIDSILWQAPTDFWITDTLNGVREIQATDLDTSGLYHRILFTVPANITVGTYNLARSTPYLGLYFYEDEYSYSETGTLTIISLTDLYIEGTFNFSASTSNGSKSIKITNGKFKILKL